MIYEIFTLILLIVIIVILIITNYGNFLLINKRHSRVAILDSCSLIDGRIIELAKAGFITDQLIVPDFIINELQLLADGSDSLKRERARYGLEVVQILQNLPGVVLSIEKTKTESNQTDDKLVELSKQIDADLYTTDFNLNQVASIKGVRVLNVNELAHSLRPTAIPGEEISIKIIQQGSSKDQGVGYLDDGTMVVVDGSKSDIGKHVKVSITKSHQTVAGRMLFAKKNTTKKQSRKNFKLKSN